jgi:hypothetical protein
MITKIIKNIFNFFGLQVNRNKNNLVIINKYDWTPFVDKKNKIFELYFDGLKKTEHEWTDSFSKQLRLYSLIQLVGKVIQYKRVFDFVECGCWRGHSSFVIASLLKKRKKNIKFHIFDSFEGLSDSTEKDGYFYKKDKKYKEFITNHFISSEEFLKDKVLKDFNFIKTYKGWIPSRFDEVKDIKISFLHIDVDLYQPTLDTLNFFFPKLVKGGVVICDDYNSTQFPGAKKALDEYFKKQKHSLFYEQPFGGCFVIK